MRGKRACIAAWFVLVPLLAACVSLVAAYPPSPLAAADRLVEAVALKMVGPQPPNDPDIVVVGITEDTLSSLPYRTPIDRAFLASLIDTLQQRHVRAIGLDVLLDRPTEPAKDAMLHEALRRPGAPVVAISVGPDTAASAEQRRFLADFLNGVRVGDANLLRDRFDNTVRVHAPYNPATGAPSLPAALATALHVAVPRDPFPIEWRRPVPGTRAGRELTTYPAQTVRLLPRAWLAGKIVLIGSLIPGSDEHQTPASAFGAPMFGVDIHARVLSQLLRDHAQPAWPTERARIGATVLLAAAGTLLGGLWSGMFSVLALVVFGTLFATVSLAVYAASGFLVPLIPPLLALTISGGFARAWRGRADRRDRRALRTLFSRFVSAPVVDQIMKDRDLFMSGGRPRPQELTATVLYADVASFTGICERLAPEPLIAWLDAYLEAMTTLIMAHKGVVLRFVGDGILAVFGVPVPRRSEEEITQDARNAAACAQAMEQAMKRLNASWATEDLPVGGLRIGLHTGPMVAGSLGRGERIEFCLLGDTANVGARLEQLGKQYAGPDPGYCTIVVGEPTWTRLGEAFPGLRIGDLSLRGRQARMGAYRIDEAAVRQLNLPGRPCPPTHPCQ